MQTLVCSMFKNQREILRNIDTKIISNLAPYKNKDASYVKHNQSVSQNI